ncbi:hypothetical protein DXX93_14000 [Thalassotalea euphylliae]|uniref:Uncharacterized protein n=1 Tax=Thalassotalea euphylliae TaxID=1655234 RepID=A0A3E0TWY8_9GAMM|nr:hypothetical protein [Thalassotalea euphylliae]REL28950.1 hypothetical protein DXX93_14000 [Thalassotalea euphylliae]
MKVLADKIATEHNKLIGSAKDLGSTGVFIALS